MALDSEFYACDEAQIGGDAVMQLQCAQLCKWIYEVDSPSVTAPFGHVVMMHSKVEDSQQANTEVEAEEDDRQLQWPRWLLLIHNSDAFLVFRGSPEYSSMLTSKTFETEKFEIEWGDLTVNHDLWHLLENDTSSVSKALEGVFAEVGVRRLVVCGFCTGGAKAQIVGIRLSVPGLQFGSIESLPSRYRLAVVTFAAPNLIKADCSALAMLQECLSDHACMSAWVVAADPVPALFSNRASQVLGQYEVNEYHESSFVTRWLRSSISMPRFQHQLAVLAGDVPDLAERAEALVCCLDEVLMGGSFEFDEAKHSMWCYIEELLLDFFMDLDEQEYQPLRTYLRKQDTTSGFLHRAAPRICSLMVEGINDPAARSRCIDVLSLVGHLGADELARQVRTQDGEIRMLALRALGSMGVVAGPHAAVVAERLTSTDSWKTRQAAAQTLGSMGDAGERYADLVATLLKDPHDFVRWTGIEVLSQMGSAGAAAAAALLSDGDARVRKIAAASLHCMGEAGAANAPAVALLLKDASDFVRLAAMSSLQNMGSHGASAAAGLLQDNDERVREAAADVLGRMKENAGPHAVAVAELLNDDQDFVRWAAMNALMQIGDAACAAVVPLLTHQGRTWYSPSGRVRAAAAKVLGLMGSKGACHAPTVALLVKDADEFVRDAAMEALCRMGPSGAEAMVEYLQDSDWKVRAMAAQVLGNMDEAGAAHAVGLAALLRDVDDCVRRTAARALSRMGQAGIAAAAHLLKDWDERVRQAATEALGCMGDSGLDIARAVAELLEDDDEFVQWAAMECLGRMGQSGLAVLTEVSTNPAQSRKIRTVAHRTLDLVTDVGGIPRFKPRFKGHGSHPAG